MIVSFVNTKGRKGCAVSLSLCPRAWGSTCVYLIAFKLPRPLCPVPLPTTISVPFCVFDAINCVHEWKKLFDFWNFYIAKAVFCVETLCKTKNLFCVRGGGGFSMSISLSVSFAIVCLMVEDFRVHWGWKVHIEDEVFTPLVPLTCSLEARLDKGGDNNTVSREFHWPGEKKKPFAGLGPGPIREGENRGGAQFLYLRAA